MGLGPAQEENKDNIYENADLEITIKDRGKGRKVVEKAIQGTETSMSEKLTSSQEDLEHAKPILEKTWKTYDLDSVKISISENVLTLCSGYLESGRLRKIPETDIRQCHCRAVQC
jgi:hypothetical protein